MLGGKQSQPFSGIRFVLVGFDPSHHQQVSLSLFRTSQSLFSRLIFEFAYCLFLILIFGADFVCGNGGKSR